MNMRFFAYGTGTERSLDDVMQVLKEFLAKNPTETVIINVCRETGTEDMSRDEQIALVNKRLKEHFDRYKDIIYGNGVFTGIPTMGECRARWSCFPKIRTKSDTEPTTGERGNPAVWMTALPSIAVYPPRSRKLISGRKPFTAVIPFLLPFGCLRTAQRSAVSGICRT